MMDGIQRRIFSISTDSHDSELVKLENAAQVRKSTGFCEMKSIFSAACCFHRRISLEKYKNKMQQIIIGFFFYRLKFFFSFCFKNDWAQLKRLSENKNG